MMALYQFPALFLLVGQVAGEMTRLVAEKDGPEVPIPCIFFGEAKIKSLFVGDVSVRASLRNRMGAQAY